MIIYNKTWLSNLLLIREVEKQYHAGLVSDDELRNIKRAYPIGFYTPGFLARVGMFLLTVVISVFSSSFLSLVFAEARIVEYYGWFIFLGIIHYVILEKMVRVNHHYRSGVDDALLWIFAGLFAGSFYWAVESSSEQYLLASGFVFLLCLFLTIRFSDILMSLVAYLSALAFVFFAWQKTGAFGLATMPFLLMTFSGLSYVIAKRYENKDITRFYTNNFLILQVISLITFYISGNYYAVKELNDMLNGTVSETIPLAWFFWLWTIFLPFIYIGLGIRNRNRVLLRSGLLLLVAAVLTFRYYYHLMPLEQALSLGGIILLGLSVWVTKYLHTPRKGFTAAEVKTQREFELLNLESLAIADTFSAAVEPVAEEGTSFGGGRFGGGGASGGY
ncbi:hypothetical protein GZH53_01600 [Flavihumibacter sp. R14]|nr:hypothetical protein [Flavihumibacter soli]